MEKVIRSAAKKPEAKSEKSVSQKRQIESSRSINSPADQIMYLQKTIGNQAIQRLIKSGALQTRIRIRRPGDKYEQEADRVEDAVMRMPVPEVHRQPEEKENLQAKKIEDKTLTTDLESNIPSLKGGGQPLPESEHAFFGARFCHDSSQVRVHTGTQAAESAIAVNAKAFTIGQYVPGTSKGKSLLAHELAHTVQQNSQTLNRQVAGGPTQAPAPCDETHTTAINTALSESRNWRSQVSRWFDSHLNHLRRAAPSTVGQYSRVGLIVLRELRLLDRHFKIRDEIRARGSIFPMSADERGDVSDFENFGNASYDIRRRFSDVELSALNFQCQVPCPSGRQGAETLGSAIPGSREFTIFTHCFDRQHLEGQAGVALHEAFHATFSNFDHDTYSFESGYPGSSPLTNADSFTNFASIIANGHTYRIIILPPIRITGSPD